MNNVFYCNGCRTMNGTKVISKKQTFNVKGRKITLITPVRICNKCGEEIFDEDLDSKTLQLFYNEYRRLENLLMPEEIKVIRNKYRLSQASFAKFLGLEEKDIARYEDGAIQTVCHDNLIRLMDSVDAFSILWEERKNHITAKEQAYIDTILK